jgi:hypothetical protein
MTMSTVVIVVVWCAWLSSQLRYRDVAELTFRAL